MSRFKAALLSASTMALLLATAPVRAENAPAEPGAEIVVVGHPQIGTFGVDLAARDTAAKPGDDFERYASGAWIDKTTIPSDRPSTGSFANLREDVQAQVQKLITDAPAGTKFGALYTAFLDEGRIERAGLKPLMADIAAVQAISDKSEFARHMGSTYAKFGSTLFNFGPYADTANPEINVLWMSQGGLGLPEKDYYFNAQFAKQRGAYYAYVERTMRALGKADPKAAAAQVMAFETEVAALSWDSDQSRQIQLINNPYSTAALKAYAPGLDWDAFFAGASLPEQQRMIVNENTAIRAIAKLVEATPLDVLKLWQEFHVADQAAPYLNKQMVDSRFAFTSSISGVTQNRPRWKRAVDLVNTSLGELVGQAYVAQHFPPLAKNRMEALVANLKVAMAGRIKTNSWMSEPTKLAALEKLAKMDVMVGYPDKWRDYSGVKADAADLYGSVASATRFNADYQMSQLGQKVDRKLWGMFPQTVNAYNGGLENKIVFPAGILQAPFFDLNADMAVNYGAIGVVIGHEISHGFDDQGRKIDAAGAVRDWWTPEDGERFNAEAKIFGAQYAAFEVVPGAFINPDLTMGENIADFAGLSVAYDAYKHALGGKEAPVIDGLTGDQRFFLGYAQVWRSKAREDSLRNQVTTDPHSPARYRTIAPLRNLEAWYQAWGIQPGDKMYIPPEKRAKIW
ncbi:M13 family metallopeptidase [Novosphingobium sp. B 225]|uniref:M13 family metallopeptidase n=1 Tax=Novosphingobium sp. B 225 TaxID=1961849 RepID=UPI000B4A5B08|nr:M13 family metallopeptidase [Novosphingobium sp. B 225]